MPGPGKDLKALIKEAGDKIVKDKTGAPEEQGMTDEQLLSFFDESGEKKKTTGGEDSADGGQPRYSLEELDAMRQQVVDQNTESLPTDNAQITDPTKNPNYLKDQETQQLVNQMEDEQKVIDEQGPGYGHSTANSFLQSVYNLPGDALQAIGIGANQVGKLTEMAGIEDRTPVEDQIMYKLGDQYKKWISELAPTNPAYQDDLMHKVSGAAGQLATLAATGGIANASKAATGISQFGQSANLMAVVKAQGGQLLKSPPALVGALQTGVNEFQQAKAAGADDDTAFGAFAKNAVAGSILEAVPVMHFFKRLDKTTGGKVTEIIKRGAIQGVDEMTTEVAQQVFANVDAANTYDTTRKWYDGMVENGGIGFGLGFLLGAMGTSLRRKQAEAKTPEERAEIQKSIDFVDGKAQEVAQETQQIENDIKLAETQKQTQEVAPEVTPQQETPETQEVINEPQDTEQSTEQLGEIQQPEGSPDIPQQQESSSEPVSPEIDQTASVNDSQPTPTAEITEEQTQLIESTPEEIGQDPIEVGEYKIEQVEADVPELRVSKGEVTESFPIDTTPKEALTQFIQKENAAAVKQEAPDQFADTGKMVNPELVAPEGMKVRENARKTIEQFPLSEELKSGLSDEAKFYKPRPVAENQRIAKENLDKLGAEKAADYVLDFDQEMNEDVRVEMRKVVRNDLDRLASEARDRGDLAEERRLRKRAIDVAETHTKGGTSTAQALNAYKEYAADKSPSQNIFETEEMIKNARKRKKKENQVEMETEIEAVKETIKESTEGVVKSKKVRAKVEKIKNKKTATKPREKEPQNPSEKKSKAKLDKIRGKNNKPETTDDRERKIISKRARVKENLQKAKDDFDKILKEVLGQANAGLDPRLLAAGARYGYYAIIDGSYDFKEWSQKMVSDLGDIIKPHLDTIWISSHDGERLDLLATEVRDYDLRKSNVKTWETYKKEAAEKIVDKLLGLKSNSTQEKAAIEEFINRLISNISKKAKKNEVNKRPKKEVLKEVIDNLEHYKDVFLNTKAQIGHTPIDSIFELPFFKNEINDKIKENLPEKLEEIVTKHYTEVSQIKEDLTKKLMDGLDLDPQDAKELADVIKSEFETLYKEKKDKVLAKKLGANKPIKSDRKKDQFHEQIIKLINLGALTDSTMSDLYVEKFDIPKLTEAQKAEITRLVEAIQKLPKDSLQQRAMIEKLLNLQENLKGVTKTDLLTSIWYGSILSGPTTQLRNIYSNTSYLISEIYRDAVYSLSKGDKDRFRMSMIGLALGMNRGLLEAGSVLKTGVAPDKTGKIESSLILERYKFAGGKYNPYNYLKYVGRFMSAADIFFYHGAKEMRAYQLAVAKAKEQGQDMPSEALRNKVYNELFNTPEIKKQAEAQAKSEGLTGRDYKRRVFEIMEQKRDIKINDDTKLFALKTTFNQDPEGVMGWFSGIISQGQKFLPVRLIVPFAKILANLTNSYLEYSPWGLVRYARNGIGWESTGGKREFTPEERAKVLISSITGTAMLLGLAALTVDQDDEENGIEITADLTGDYKKNYEINKPKYSIRIGKQWYSYMDTPLAIPMAIVGFMNDAEKYHNQKDAGTRAAIIAFGTIKFVSDLSFLKGLSDFLDSFAKSGKEGADSFIREMKKQTVTVGKNLIVPNLYTQSKRIIDEYMGTPIKDPQTVLEQIYRDIPIANDGMNNLINSLGEEVIPDMHNRLIPFQAHEQKPHQVYDLLNDKNAFISRISRGQLEYQLGRAVSDKEYYDFSKRRGELIKERILQNFKELSSLNPTEARKKIKKYKEKATKKAKYEIFADRE
jgi:hypothetical protein